MESIRSTSSSDTSTRNPAVAKSWVNSRTLCVRRNSSPRSITTALSAFSIVCWTLRRQALTYHERGQASRFQSFHQHRSTILSLHLSKINSPFSISWKSAVDRGLGRTGMTSSGILRETEWNKRRYFKARGR